MDQPDVFIVMEESIIQAVITPSPLKVLLLDYCRESTDDPTLEQIPQDEEGRVAHGYVQLFTSTQALNPAIAKWIEGIEEVPADEANGV